MIMIRKIVMVLLTVAVCLTALAAVVGRYYPLGLTIVDDGATYVGLRAEDGMALVLVEYMTEHAQGPEKRWKRSIGATLTGDLWGFAILVNILEPVFWTKRTIENRCGAPYVMSTELDTPYPPGTFHGMSRQVGGGLHFAPLMLLATIVTIVVVRRPLRQYRRHKRGLCLKCSYDLTGNESGVCPECGKAVRS